jgi:plastocyanin
MVRQSQAADGPGSTSFGSLGPHYSQVEEADNLKTMVRIACLALLAMVFAACSGGGNTIDVSLSEWQVDPSPTSATSGDVEFSVTNDGGEQHEMVIVKDIAPEDLPVDADGHVVEDDIPEGAVIGEVAEFDAGTTETQTFNLEPGTYTIFCNIIETEDGATVSHFANGMHNTITVTS